MAEQGRWNDLYFCFTHMGIPCQVEHVYLYKFTAGVEIWETGLFYRYFQKLEDVDWEEKLSNYVLKYKIHIVLTFILVTINISFLNDNFNYQKHIISCYRIRNRERERKRSKGRREEGEVKQRRKRKRRRHESLSRRLYRPRIPRGAGGKESKAVEFPLFPVSGPRGPYGVSRGGQYLHITTSWRGDHRRWHKILLCCLLSPREPRVAL